ncbi:iron-binding zinc finger CDGSH type family protein [Mycolicibacterium hassiacum DSM 44199]|jgi:CDGSH-type Zn-finger protein|uniref:Iron-binding zinc finger CDGSH type family protein n=2 Tax=Mycolicibacterium hassiacum TaxID=46351 RepID=K5BD65_MYCHD|nr:CDGSH iron-sulfur domain-containing protein [Mycolicibacterium hassiacum]EKF22027.1 iron-binding zinc finger CDGSH type family protein [Mycolicibacterium hassiacum DSM 44199]MDA4086875.1 iron-binding protein [Mycolicibacterium hassiacum DSM 44199]PZN20854.1 MAG: CDGSH iron-sulfur domain-containing protein [Mycolicibacterium hassiacum]VCT92159.1 hypothetical protein MHAS_03885 [Mycolicibacterium hassiacum DSM 44199]
MTPDRAARIVRVVPGGPVMVQGPVRIELPDGSTVESDRFMVAICACRRSRTYPLCDTSHRCRTRRNARDSQEPQSSQNPQSSQDPQSSQNPAQTAPR